LRLKRKKRRMEKRAAVARGVVQAPLLDRTNVGLPDEVEVDWHQKTLVPNTQLTIPEDLQSTHSGGSVCYRGDTQREMM
jgi:hypothetical protein